MIPATSITINRAEGHPRECGSKTVMWPEVWDKAAEVLRGMRHTAPPSGEGYHKCDFVVKYEDGREYKGRIDLNCDSLETIETHMRSFLTCTSGRGKPGHLSQERYDKFLKVPRVAELIPGAIEWLDNYQIG